MLLNSYFYNVFIVYVETLVCDKSKKYKALEKHYLDIVNVISIKQKEVVKIYN